MSADVNDISDHLGALRCAAVAVALEPGLAWLREARGCAFESFSARGFPTTTDEDWRYTDLREAAALAALRAANSPLPPSTELDALLPWRTAAAVAGTVVVFTDGQFRPELSRLPGLTGLRVTPLSRAAPHSRAELAARMTRLSTDGTHSLVALNAALLRDGLSIDVAPGTVIADPIYVVLAGGAGGASYNRLLISLGAGSTATVIEHHVSLGSSFSNSVTDMHCDRDSRLVYVKLQAEADAATHLAFQNVDAEKASHVDLLHLDLGARLARNDLVVKLLGRGATVTAHGLFFADRARHLDNHTRIDHAAPQTTSRELYRGIADGRGRGVFNGKVIVHQGADKADARLSNQNLLLSGVAEIDTKPELEIYADDVKCSHGATTGQLDADAIFYLRSRGISAAQARTILIASFARQIIKHVPFSTLDDHVVGLLRNRLPEMHEVAQQS